MSASDRFIEVGGIRTHYLEAGDGHPLILLHSGEFGASAEVSWEFSIGPLSKHFRVIAPDWLGFGQSAKIFSFDGMAGFRIQTISAVLRAIGIETAHFVGNSMGGGQLARAAGDGAVPLSDCQDGAGRRQGELPHTTTLAGYSIATTARSNTWARS